MALMIYYKSQPAMVRFEVGSSILLLCNLMSYVLLCVMVCVVNFVKEQFMRLRVCFHSIWMIDKHYHMTLGR